MTPRCEQILENGLAAMALPLSSTTQQRLLDYVALLHKWNKAYNLTAVRDPEQMVSRHVLDSLSIMPWVTGPCLLDIGAGAGLPGLVLAMVNPELQVTLVDSNGKKVRFQQHACLALGIDNAVPVHTRIEAFNPPRPFEQIVSRAFSSLTDFVELSQPFLAQGGEWLAMKGRLDTEDTTLPSGVQAHDSVPLNVPGETGQRHLVRVRKTAL
ncbi:16S rRNA (guanine(527)-N(7))-methyltransferase RsmG [Larsenimonas rhizosphaerae]|uniref:Ribosomal RNA small subunit methyltransferase G n=1 Tax=Larsenimonas rhizosphaerae TaxID=2944682 RepID=A0AA42CXI6_9GAMM|nr:16S rRNA (guanine(527)-N(7))-methyltransferase RsmG [Larsenimonas rhizosphaerae]MCM2129276.1 16S rRNA (guanine(527)-N(7))-methyltransferase RsmG [Larsenimonas rhizosphaerae]MCX2523928.1 16S rRNA (guanine(527)-N(7))-methyltransferase RsmG [Larsenimonas rhizosphaerae]